MGGAKAEGDTPVHNIHWIPESVLAALGKPDSNAASIRRFFKTSALGIIGDFDEHNKKLMDKKGNEPARLFRMFNLKRRMESEPNKDWSKFAADLENFHADVSSILVSGESRLLMTMTFDSVSLKRLNTTISELLKRLIATNFAVERTVPLSDVSSKPVKEIIESGRFSIAITHAEITNEAHLRSDYVAKLASNSNANAGEVSVNTLRQRDLPKVGFVSEQQLTQANAAKKVQAGAKGISEKQGKKYETTTHESLRFLGLKRCEEQKLQNDLVAFQRNGFKETTVKVNSKRTVTIKLFPWNRFDSQGRSATDRA